MTPAAHLTRLRRRIALWLAVLMTVSGGMASGLSHGAMRTDPAAPWLAEICTTPEASSADNTAAPSGNQRGTDSNSHLLRHCPLCLLGSPAFGPPPAPAVWWPLVQGVAVHVPWHGTPQIAAAPVWRALPRGPPGRQRL